VGHSMESTELEAIIQETDLFKVLGLEFTASPEDVRMAYKKLAKQAHPDMFTDFVLKEKAEQAFIRIGEAFNTLRDPFKRKDYERTLDRVREAEERAREAERAKQAKAQAPPAPSAKMPPKPQVSKEAAEKALNARKEQAEVHFKQGKQHESKNMLDEAVREYQECIRLCNEEAKYHSQLGLVLQKKKWTGYAQAEFKVALHFDPTDKIALKNYQPSAGLTIPRNSLGFKLLNMFKGGSSNRIGDILIQQGHLKKDQLQQALKQQSDEKLLLGEILIRMKYIKAEHLAQALIHQGETLAKEAGENQK
jgi:tetratricopeptide (TPR) repeat protein